jgi:hypothetical protein
MKHDIDAINAALRLGDCPLPPIGAVVRNIGTDRCGRVCVIHCIYGNVYAAKLVSNEFYFYWCIRKPMRASFYEFVEIPEDAPPFGEWERV